MDTFPYTLDTKSRPAIGLIVLQADETIEREFRYLIPPGIADLYVTRIPSGDAVTPETLAAMENELSAAASLLPPNVTFDVIGYGCTSGTAAIGAARVTELVKAGAKAKAITNPLSAVKAAMDHEQIKRVGIVSPYTPGVLKPIIRAFEEHGIEVASTVSFGEEVETRVAHIDTRSIINAARALVSSTSVDGIFLSCTNLRTLAAIDILKEELGIPVLSSNQSIAWHLQKLAETQT